MAIVAQVPVMVSLPSPLLPPTKPAADEGALVARVEGPHPVVPPARARLREDMWLSSGMFHVLDAEVSGRRVT